MALALAVDAALPGPAWLTSQNFVNWDAEHYNYIRQHGYDFRRTAFFPLFPFLWRWLGVGAIGMGLVNAALFATSFALLAWQLGWSVRQQVLLLCVPSLMFMALPYTEAVFFMGGVLVLVGLRRNATGLYCLGLLVCCVSRSAALVLAPAVVITSLLANPATMTRRGRIIQALAGVFTAFLGLGLSVLVHYQFTGRWFVFLEAHKLWGNQLRLPRVPFSNWGGSFPTYFEGPAFTVGLAASVVLVAVGWQRWGGRLPAVAKRLEPASAPMVFSLAYVAGVTAIALATDGGILVSLSRYVYATPWFLLLLATYVGQVRLTGRQLGWLALTLEICWLLLFKAYGHIRSLGGWSLVTVVVMLWLANAYHRNGVRRAIFWPTAMGGTALLLLLLFRFLRHQWVA